MRFLSPNPKYKFTGRKEEYELLASGQFRQTRRPFICEFEQDTTNWEQEFARENFKFRGVPHDESGVRDIDPVPFRLSSFDTETIEDPELRKEVEERLLAWQNPNDHLLCERPELAPPWPAYSRLVAQGRRTDEMVAEKIAEKVKEDGYDASEVLEYEETHLNRQSVISKLRELQRQEPEEHFISA
jgi:hypothetical protein